MGSSGGGNDGGCLPYHKLLATVALVICAGGVLIGTGEGGNPCHSKTRDGVAMGTFCPTKKEDYCCPGACGDSVDGCMRSSLSIFTLAGIICMIVAIFMMLMIPILCFLDKRKTLSIEDLDKNPGKIDKFRRASLEARRASLNSAKMHAEKGDASPATEPAGALASNGRRGSKIAIQNQEVVLNPVAQAT